MVAYQPTIPIKNKNGTVEYVTLEEFEKRKIEMASKSKEERKEKPVVLEEKVENRKKEMEKNTAENIGQSFANNKPKIKKVKKKNLPAVESPHELATTTPVTDIFLDEAEAKLTWNKDDHKSLLEEESPELAKKYQHKPEKVDNKQTNFSSLKGVKLPDDLLLRLKSLVVSFQKGIRNKHQFLSYATQTVKGGGLALSKQVANNLLDEISTTSESDQKKILKKERREALKTRNIKKPFTTLKLSPQAPVKKNKKSFDNTKKISDLKGVNPVKPVSPVSGLGPETETDSLSLTNPLDFIVPAKKEAQKISPVVQPPIVPPPIKKQVFKPSDKSLVHDVTSAVTEEQAYKTVGPEEEIGNFTLTDFRRLSADSQKAGELLLYKFQGWKEESYLLYLKTVRAWQKSPLYLSYISISRTALEMQRPVKDLLPHESTGDQMTEDEYKVFIKVNKDL